MANGRNQGLQVAVIVSAIITLIAVVVAVVSYKGYSNREAEWQASQKAAQDANDAAQLATEDLRRLKKLIRAEFENVESFSQLAEFDSGDNLIGGAIAEDLQMLDDDTGTEHYPDYSHALQAYYERVDSLSAQLNNAQANNVGMEDQNILRDQVTTAQIDMHKDARDAAEQDLATERATFQSKISDLEEQTARFLAMADRAAHEREQLRLDAQQKEEQQAETIQQQRALIESLRERLANFEEATFERGDGQIVFVSSRQGLVWINRGSADNLPKQQTFSVYSSEQMNVAKKRKKADIEVTRIAQPHLAEARITSYTSAVGDPILEGDVIYTPVWSPGRQREFALAGFMDIDGDGESDRETVKNVILNGGGLIVAELTDSGEIQTMRDGININTKYLIMGDRPEVSEFQPETDANILKVLRGMSDMIERARNTGVEIISVEDFLEEVGYQPHMRLVKPGGIMPPPRPPAGAAYEREARRGSFNRSTSRFAGNRSRDGVGGY